MHMQPVTYIDVYRRAFGRACSALAARRVSYHIDKLRPRLSPFGMLLREPREP
jgi:hypothetical protein